MTVTDETLDRAAIHKNLVAVRELLSDPSKYTFGVYARDADGCAVSPTVHNDLSWMRNPEATCFCFAGAYRWIAGTPTGVHKVESELSRLSFGRFGLHFTEVSDHDHESCLALIDYFITEFAPPPAEGEAAQ